jgi:cation transport ATPase
MTNNFKSRKFWTLIVVYIASLGLTLGKPALIDSTTVLFNFWTMIAGIFFGTDIYGGYQTAKNNGGDLLDYGIQSKKFIVFLGLLFTSFILTWVGKVESAADLFTFWGQLCGLYFTGNVVEKQLKGRAQRVSKAFKEQSAKIPID